MRGRIDPTSLCMVGEMRLPKGPPNPPPIPPPKNCLNRSSGDISSSNMLPPRPAPGDLAKLENGDEVDADANRLSGSPPV